MTETPMMLDEHHQVLLLALAQTHTPVVTLNAARHIIHVNEAFTTVLGYQPEEVIGRSPASFLISQAMNCKEMEAYQQKEWGKHQVKSETLVRRQSGDDIWMWIDSMPIIEPEQSPLAGCSVDIMIDITEDWLIRDLERNTLHALVSNLSYHELGNYMCRSVREIAPDIVPSILRVDADNLLRPWAVSMLPAPYNAAIDGVQAANGLGSCGTAVARGEPIISEDIATDPIWASIAHLALPHGFRACWSFPIWLRDGRVGGTFAFYSKKPAKPSPFHLRIIDACVKLCSLAIEREESRIQATRLMHFDALTGLPNRNSLHHYVDDFLAGNPAKPAAFFCIDIDRFSEFNDALGHAFGDRILVEIATRLQQQLLPGEFLSRGDGSEFIIVAPICDVRAAARRAENLRKLFSHKIEVAEHLLSVSATTGISVYPANGRDRSTLLGAAANAMRHAKTIGSGTFQFFNPEMNQIVQERLLLSTLLVRAIEQGRLSLHYQPQIRTGGEIYGVEALSRWRDPRHGDIPPSRFIELAEDRGLIAPIRRWALREACRQLAIWRSEARPIPTVAVNLSPLNFLENDLPDFIAQLFNEYTLEGRDLTIEITESAAMALTTDMLATVNNIRALGVGLSVDDFGTGFSSLSRLITLPVTEIKIDRSFINRFQEAKRHRLLVEAVIGLGRSLDLTVVAEGVETLPQRTLLEALGCPVLQGYFISPALSAPRLTEWLHTHASTERNG